MLKTKKELAYLIAIAVIALAILGVIIYGVLLHKSAAKPEATPPAPATETDTGFSLVKEEETVSFETVQDGLREMGALATEEYHFTEVISYSNLKQFLGIDLPWTETNYIASYDGVILAGIDFAKVAVESETVDGQPRLTVTIPKAELQSTDIDPDSFVLYSEKTGLGNPLSASDFNSSLDGLEKDVQAKALKKGVLDRAQAHAKQIIEGFVASLLNGTAYTLEIVVK